MDTIKKESKKKYLWNILYKTLFIFIVLILVFIWMKDIDDSGKIIMLSSSALFFGWFLGFGLPTIALFINHYKQSKSILFSENDKVFTYSSKKDNFDFKEEDIDKIELWLTPSRYDKRIDWQYFGDYHFSKFYLKSGEIFELSCLIFDKTEEVFSKKIIERKKKFFPFLSSLPASARMSNKE